MRLRLIMTFKVLLDCATLFERGRKFSQLSAWLESGTGHRRPVLRSRNRSEPVQRSGSGSTIDKTDEFHNDILFVSFHIDTRLFKKQILVHK